jgi:transcription elongation factor Elf1
MSFNSSNSGSISNSKKEDPLQDSFERAELLTKYQCPNCKKSGYLKEIIDNDEIWAKCTHCKKSGFEKRIIYDNLVFHLDVFSTIYDVVKGN